MTLKNCTVIEAETYKNAINQLHLNSQFEQIYETSLNEFDVTNRDMIPSEILVTVLETAPSEYWWDQSKTGVDTRYRIVLLG